MPHDTTRRKRRRVYPRDITEQEYLELWEAIFHESGARIPDHPAEDLFDNSQDDWRDR